MDGLCSGAKGFVERVRFDIYFVYLLSVLPRKLLGTFSAFFLKGRTSYSTGAPAPAYLHGSYPNPGNNDFNSSYRARSKPFGTLFEHVWLFRTAPVRQDPWRDCCGYSKLFRVGAMGYPESSMRSSGSGYGKNSAAITHCKCILTYVRHPFCRQFNCMSHGSDFAFFWKPVTSSDTW